MTDTKEACYTLREGISISNGFAVMGLSTPRQAYCTVAVTDIILLNIRCGTEGSASTGTAPISRKQDAAPRGCAQAMACVACGRPSTPAAGVVAVGRHTMRCVLAWATLLSTQTTKVAGIILLTGAQEGRPTAWKPPRRTSRGCAGVVWASWI